MFILARTRRFLGFFARVYLCTSKWVWLGLLLLAPSIPFAWVRVHCLRVSRLDCFYLGFFNDGEQIVGLAQMFQAGFQGCLGGTFILFCVHLVSGLVIGAVSRPHEGWCLG